MNNTNKDIILLRDFELPKNMHRNPKQKFQMKRSFYLSKFTRDDTVEYIQRDYFTYNKNAARKELNHYLSMNCIFVYICLYTFIYM